MDICLHDYIFNHCGYLNGVSTNKNQEAEKEN